MTQQVTGLVDENGGRARVRARRGDSRKPRRRSAPKDRSEDNGDDGGQGPKPKPKPDILKMLMTELAVSPEEAGTALGLGRSSAYRAVRNKQIPSIKIGGKFIVSTAWLRRVLDLDPVSPSQIESMPTPTPIAEPVPSTPRPKQVSPRKRQRRRRR